MDGKNERWMVTTGEMEELFGVTKMALTGWKKAKCPKEGHGMWYLPDVLRWFRNTRNTPAETQENEDMRERKLRADTEYREERAQRERLLREALEGLYFLRSDVEKAWADRAFEAKAAFLLFEKTLPLELVGKDENKMEAIIAARVREVLNDYARDGKYTPDPEKAPAGKSRVAPAGKAKGKRVGRQKQSSGPKD